MCEDRCIGEIVIAVYSRVPLNLLPCDGRTLSISQYTALYSIIGTQFGGDGQQSFALPDFRGVFPVGATATSVVGKRVPQVGTVPAGQDNPVTIGTTNVPLLAGTATLAQNVPVSATTTVKARQATGVPTPSAGFMLGQCTTGGGAADIYVDPNTAGVDVQLGGVTTTANINISTPIPVQVGTAAPSPLNLPRLAINFYIVAIGIYPQFN